MSPKHHSEVCKWSLCFASLDCSGSNFINTDTAGQKQGRVGGFLTRKKDFHPDSNTPLFTIPVINNNNQCHHVCEGLYIETRGSQL